MSFHPKLENFEEDEDDDENDDKDYVPKEANTQEKTDLSGRKEIQTRTKIYQVAAASVEVEAFKPEEKKKADDLWSDFIKDVQSQESPIRSLNQETPKNSTASGDLKKAETSIGNRKSLDLFGDDNSATTKNSPVPNKNKQPVVTQAEPHSVKVNDRLSSILAKINKEPKISTLQKSVLDWNEFKQSENIEEELDIQNRGKNSYLDKKAFLERADYREFEIERDLRNKKLKKF